MTDNEPGLVEPTQAEDLGRCIGCNEPLRAGEVVTPWDDEVGHYDCKRPTSLDRIPVLDDDPDCPPPVVLLGNPARYVPLDSVREAYDTRLSSTQPLTEQLAERDAEIARLRRRLTDSEYLREAYRQMLGEKGREVARVWEEKGLVRVHMSWTVDPYSLPGEEVAETLLAWEAAPRTPLTDVDVDAALAEKEGK